MTENEMLEWIKRATYEELMEKVRREPCGSRWFVGDVGKAFVIARQVRASTLTQAEKVAVSKRVGWSS